MCTHWNFSKPLVIELLTCQECSIFMLVSFQRLISMPSDCSFLHYRRALNKCRITNLLLNECSSFNIGNLSCIWSKQNISLEWPSFISVINQHYGLISGVATAFAAKDILGNMLTGFSLQFMKPFSIGDVIRVWLLEGYKVKLFIYSLPTLSYTFLVKCMEWLATDIPDILV